MSKQLDITRVQSLVKEYFDSHPDLDMCMKNHRWVGEDGQQYSSWDISTPGMTIHTGDGGAELMIKTLKKTLIK